MASDFPFIVSTGPKVARDGAQRTLIRKQAMKDVGIARKKRNTHGRVNQRQAPAEPEKSVGQQQSPDSSSESDRSGWSTSGKSTSTSPPTSVDEPVTAAGEQDADAEELVVSLQARQLLGDWDLQSYANTLIPNPVTAYEAFRLTYNFDVQDLSSLTSFHVGKPVLHTLARSPALLHTLLGHRIDSYLEFIPSRYGTKPYFNAAVECLAARAYSRLRPYDSRSKAVALRSYAKALRALQEAVADDQACDDADLIAAVQMLGLREIVDADHGEAYSSHVAGSARLVRRRSPAGFSTDYEKWIFLAHMGPAFTEAMYKSESCYLEAPEWIRLYESFAQPNQTWLSDRSELVIRARVQMLHLNSLMLDVSKILNLERSPDAMLLMKTELRVRQAHMMLLRALEDYKAHVVRTSMMSAPISELNQRREIFGTILECLILYKRLLGALCEDERLQLERETLSLLDILVDLDKHQPNSKYSWIYTTQERGVAQIIQLTTQDWQVDLSHLSAKERHRESCERWKRMTNYLHGGKDIHV